MALTGLKFCKTTVADNKKQNIRFQPLHLMSSATMIGLHQSKNIDFPFVPLTGHKLVEDPCIPTDFSMADHTTKFDGDFSFDKSSNFTNTRTIFKNASLKGCHQFPMISISQLVGGFVGSKSQVRANNRESHQIWDIVFQKLDEFVHSKPVERYSEHCYALQALSHNLLGSLYEESNSALGIAAASYILADRCQSFQDIKRPDNHIKSSPPIQNSTATIPTPVNTFVSLNQTPTSHFPCNQPTVPVVTNIAEHLISNPDLSHHNTVIAKPLAFACVDQSVSTSSPVEHSALSDNLVQQQHGNLEPFRETTSTLSGVKHSYAEVTKMSRIKCEVNKDRHMKTSRKPSKRYRKIKNNHFDQNCDSRQRCADTNWRSQTYSAGMKDVRRDHFTPVRSNGGNSVRYWRCEKKSDVPMRSSVEHQRKNHEGLKYFKNRPVTYTGGILRTVPENNPNCDKEMTGQADSSCLISDKTHESSCQFYNPKKKSCMNWRCRQHFQKSSAKRDLQYILFDNVIGDDVDDLTTSSDLSPISSENSDNRVNTFEKYIKLPSSNLQLVCNSDSLKLPTRARSNSESSVKSLPSSMSVNECSLTLATRALLEDVNAHNDLERPRSLSETIDSCVKSLSRPAIKERSSSESSESIKNVQRSRSISEESKSNSLSSSSISSSSSCKIACEANLRRRFSSECDSEDSFVIFDGSVDCDDCNSLDSLSDSSEECSESENDDDEVDSACPRVSMLVCLPIDADDIGNPVQSSKLQELNLRWEIMCSQAKKEPCKKVRFASSPCLETVHRMVKWDYAYRAARCGPWEEMARDRERFKQRVERVEAILAPVLGTAHREKVRQRLADTSP